MRTLYLGLDPKRFPRPALHYPVIRTVPIYGDSYQRALELWPCYTHVIFTSRTAVRLWPYRGKPIIAIGEATAEGLEGVVCAKRPTQEGVIELLQQLSLKNAHLFLPKSKRARPLLVDFLQKEGICHTALDLYDIEFFRKEPIPDLTSIDEIVFTSPSTVEGFLRIYKKLPRGKKLTAIGPVTQAALRNC